jgi:hypothetical protein
MNTITVYEGNWGDWSYTYLDGDYLICGILLRTEIYQKSRDDTALNAIKVMKC